MMSSAQICMRTHDGVNLSGGFQIAPKTSGLQKLIMSVGQVADRSNIIAFRSSGGRSSTRELEVALRLNALVVSTD